MTFTCNETPTLLSLDSIILAIKADGSSFTEDPENTSWYIEHGLELAVMIHPAFGMVFYNSDMGIEGFCDIDELEHLSDILDTYEIETNSMVWREIGIDQIDFHYTS